MRMASEQSWNEIQFLSWDKFKGMTPSIVQLEITRITKLMRTGVLDLDEHNALVRVRYALKQFIDCLEASTLDNMEETCGPFATQALMNMPDISAVENEEAAETLAYIVDRIKDLLQRIPLVY